MRKELKNPAREAYIAQLFAEEKSVHKTIRVQMEKEGFDHMSLSPIEGQMLKFYTKFIGAKNIVEVGSLLGYSAVWMADALPEDGKIYCLEISEERAALIQKNFEQFNMANKLEVLTGDAMEQLSKLEDKAPFDMCFIDANKGAYVKYLDWADKNIKKGGLIIGDNTFLFGGVYDEENSDESKNRISIMKEFNKRLADQSKYNSMLFPTAEGMTIAQKLF